MDFFHQLVNQINTGRAQHIPQDRNQIYQGVGQPTPYKGFAQSPQPIPEDIQNIPSMDMGGHPLPGSVQYGTRAIRWGNGPAYFDATGGRAVNDGRLSVNSPSSYLALPYDMSRLPKPISKINYLGQ